jgi:uncharacterized protein
MESLSHPSMRILIHAPTANALNRARSNVINLTNGASESWVRIIVNADAVEATLDMPNTVTDALTLVCPNTLAKIGRDAPAPLTVLAEGAIAVIARMQLEGWCYVRA